MTTVAQIINISVSKNTQPVSRASQNYPLILAQHAAFTERSRTYSSLDGVAEDFIESSNVYKMAQDIFQQPIVPSFVYVGRKQADTLTGTINTVASSTVYSVTINGTTYDITSDSSATAIEIVAALDTDVGSPTGIAFTDNLDGTFTVGPTVAGTAWSISCSSNITLTNATSGESWVEAYQDVRDVNDNWYCLHAETHTKADQLALAAVIETTQKIYVTSTSDSVALTTGTSDVGKALKDLGYERTACMWHSAADTQFPECGWAGRQLQDTPGSNDWAYKEIVGVTPDSFSETQSGNVHGKNYTTYETLDGVNRTVGGDMVDGTAIDETVFLDWVVINMRADLWQMFANVRKAPYTSSGLTMIESKIRAVNARGIANGGIAENPAPVVQMPVLALISSIDKANRHVPGIVNKITLAGSIRTIAIRIDVDV
jgi:hypothetical protein